MSVLELHPIDPPANPSLSMEYRPFPLHCLPEPVRDYVAESASALGVDHAFVALPALAACAAAIGNTRVIQLKRGWAEPSIVWAAIVADSGTLKSPSLDAGVGQFYRVQQKLLKQHAEEMVEYANEKLSAKGTDKPPPQKPVASRVLVSDTTIEKLGQILSDNQRGVLLKRDELSAWFGSFSRYKQAGASDLPAWLELHRAGHLLIDRKTGESQTLHVPRASVSITGTIQPGVLRRCLTAEARESGLAARFLLAMPPKPPMVWREVETAPETEKKYEQLFDRLFALGFRDAGEPFALRLDAEAKDSWVRFYNAWGQKIREAEGDRAALLSKLQGAAARLALLHHVVSHAGISVDDRSPVTAASIDAGVELAKWFADEADRIYSVLAESDEERSRRTLIEMIQARGGSMTVRELMRANNRRFADAALAENAMNQLAHDRLGEWIAENPAKGGHARRVFRLFQQPEAKIIGAGAVHDSCVTVDPEPANSSGKNGECHAVMRHAEVKPSPSERRNEPGSGVYLAPGVEPEEAVTPFDELANGFDPLASRWR